MSTVLRNDKRKMIVWYGMVSKVCLLSFPHFCASCCDGAVLHVPWLLGAASAVRRLPSAFARSCPLSGAGPGWSGTSAEEYDRGILGFLVPFNPHRRVRLYNKFNIRLSPPSASTMLASSSSSSARLMSSLAPRRTSQALRLHTSSPSSALPRTPPRPIVSTQQPTRSFSNRTNIPRQAYAAQQQHAGGSSHVHGSAGAHAASSGLPGVAADERMVRVTWPSGIESRL